jgi:hypothetical protein
MWTRPQAVHLDPTKANFQLSERADGGPAGLSGSGRRGVSRSIRPRQLR